MPLYFIAITTPAVINQQVIEWKNYMQNKFNCRVALRSPAHITLIPPFNMQPDNEKSIIDSLCKFSAQQKEFKVLLKNFAAFKPRVIYVSVEISDKLLQLKKNLEEFLLKENKYPVKKEDRPFHPHNTIANRDLKKADFSPAWEYFSKILYETFFMVNSISLLRSTADGWQIVEECTFAGS